MKNDYINISSILTHLDAVIREHVCKRCYVGTLPSTLEDGAMDMVVIDCGNTIRDLNAYGKGTINIYMYAQPVGGQMNVFALSELERKFSKAIRENKFDSEYYSVPDVILLSGQGYDTTYNMHYYIKSIRMLILGYS